MDRSGWWISPGGESLEIIDHFETVRAEPDRFGFRGSEAARWTRADRSRVLRKAIHRGWIRVRGHGDYTTFEVRGLDPGTVSRIARHLRAVAAWETEIVEIHELGLPKRSRMRAERLIAGSRSPAAPGKPGSAG